MTTDFLSCIAATSHARAGRACRDVPLGALRRQARATPRPPRLELGEFGLIAEVKLAAPSVDAPPAAPEIAERVRAYVAGGARAISVLTEPTRFGGALAHLRAASEHSGGLPTMRKDFLVDPYQVVEARAAGAGGVLLIAELLDDQALDACLGEARALDLFVLLEAFGELQLARARARATDPADDAPVLCGINCRDLRTLAVDPSAFELHAERTGLGRHAARTIAESGIRSPADVEAVARLGYRGALVGTALMRASDPATLVAEMAAAGRRARCACA